MRASVICLSATLLVASPLPALAFNQAGCGAGECKDCHELEKAEAEGFLSGMANTVESVGFAQIPGLFEVKTVTNGNRFSLYVDFGKSWVMQANVARVRGKGSCGQAPVPKAGGKPMTVDLSKLALDGSLVLGKKDAKRKVVVFTDPMCPYCRKLHEEMKKAVESDPTVAFYIRLMPLAIHQGAYDLCKSVVCAGTLAALEDAFAGKKLPPAPSDCKAKALDDTIAFAKANGISSTPTIVLPDGKVVPGFRKAEELIRLAADGAGEQSR